MQDSDDTPVNTKPPPRKKETVRIRQTSSGWVEVNELDGPESKGSEDAVVNEKIEDTATEKEESLPVAGNETAGNPFVPSSQASWHAFANETAADAEITDGFQVSQQRVSSPTVKGFVTDSFAASLR